LKTYNLVWGESVVVRNRFLESTRGIPIKFGLKELSEMDYTPFNGDVRLISETAKVIKTHTGLSYKHIFLTNGASGGCTIALRAYAQLGKKDCIVNPPPFFPLYPSMAKAAGLNLVTQDCTGYGYKHSVVLLDSPANPSGNIIGSPSWAFDAPVVWDAVYHNAAYARILTNPPPHTVMVGSFSKLTGLNGLRLGWIATNDDVLADKIGMLIAPEYCGLSKPSKMILLTLLDQFNSDPEYFWREFECNARYWLDLNCEEWSKVEKYFGDTPGPINGMFYYAPVDAACARLLQKANVLYLSGSKCGTTDDFGRFNIGQDTSVIKNAVKSILKKDQI
jgi:aspartate/methionine/tyrosine aminotransferase